MVSTLRVQNEALLVYKCFIEGSRGNFIPSTIRVRDTLYQGQSERNVFECLLGGVRLIFVCATRDVPVVL